MHSPKQSSNAGNLALAAIGWKSRSRRGGIDALLPTNRYGVGPRLGVSIIVH
jgi:hypothetical protein